ncbi:MAG: DUF4468 domain-containing protein [Prevotella sp.]|jgi:colicin import membrane protein
MKRLLIAVFFFVPALLMAQNNTWEVPQQQVEAKSNNNKKQEKKSEKKKATVNPKYLAGAITTDSEGKIVFTLDYDCPNLTAQEIYEREYKLMNDLTKQENQLEGSRVAIVNKAEHKIVTTFRENLVFSKSFLSLDQTEFHYALMINCTDGHVHAEMSRLYYLYETDRKTGMKAPAEEVITDDMALNKSKTKLAHFYGKFRRETIDRKDNLFNSIINVLQ